MYIHETVGTAKKEVAAQHSLVNNNLNRIEGRGGGKTFGSV